MLFYEVVLRYSKSALVSTQHLPSSAGQSALKFTHTLGTFGNCNCSICFGANAELCISFNAGFQENKMYSEPLIEISGRTGHCHHFSEFLEHLGKMHLFCGLSFHLQPRKFKYKIWIENDFKEASLNFLHVKANRKSLFWRQKNKMKQSPQSLNHWALPQGVPRLCMPDQEDMAVIVSECGWLECLGQCQLGTYTPQNVSTWLCFSDHDFVPSPKQNK